MLPVIQDGSAPNKLTSFWERKEGVTGMIVLGFLALGGAFVLKAILPWLNSLLTDAIAAGLKFVALGAICAFIALVLFLITNKKVQLLVKYAFKSSMRKLTQLFVEIDPIGIMKGFIDTLKEKKEAFDGRKAQLKGQISVFDQTIASNAKAAEEAMRMAQAAKSRGMNNKDIMFHGREAERYKETNKTLGVTLAKMNMLYKALEKYGEACDFMIRDLASDVRLREQERKMMLTSHSAISGAMAILKGTGDERELYDQAMEYVVEDYAQKMGEIDDFMLSTETILKGIDLKNGMWEDAALKELEIWEAKTDSTVLGQQKRAMIEDGSTSYTSLIDLNRGNGEKVPVAKTDDYQKFFK